MGTASGAARTLIGRSLGFALVPLLTALAPLVTLPVLTRAVGADGWASIAVALSIGTACAVIAEWGYSLTGPTRVAALDAAQRAEYYTTSVGLRLCLSFFIAPVAAGATFMVVHDLKGLAAACAAAVASGSLSANWYFIGRGDARSLILWDCVPRIAVAVVAAGVIAAGSSLAVYPLSILLGNLGALWLSTRVVLRTQCGGGVMSPNLSEVRRACDRQRSAALTRITSSIYVSLSVTLVALVAAPAVVANFAALDRLEKYALMGLAPVTQAVQGWVASAEDFRYRARTGLVVSTLCGAVGAVILFVSLPYAIRLLFGPDFEVTLIPRLLMSLAVLIVCCNRGLAVCYLVPAGATAVLLRATIWGAVIGCVSILVLAMRYGVAGAAAAVCLTECAVLVVQAIGSRSWSARHRTRQTPRKPSLR
ncbi:lipopolysaccharide biosynthesis protein [Nocardioides sp. zg-1230]|uniref:lipopolysaccharide biosynthesis protein n=1 Tax=Nocardioides sp. zg-1230 TaxID=2736601 RepID=UPI0015566B43|nr:oligosaccharide flippase family protein [Nocardioides sp. zg-1230]NPC41215.1 oligosaccharide flippase family protein [Nocardioides sp. zg-1230]